MRFGDGVPTWMRVRGDGVAQLSSSRKAPRRAECRVEEAALWCAMEMDGRAHGILATLLIDNAQRYVSGRYSSRVQITQVGHESGDTSSHHSIAGRGGIGGQRLHAVDTIKTVLSTAKGYHWTRNH